MNGVRLIAAIIALCVGFFLCLIVWFSGAWAAHWVAAAVVIAIGIYYWVVYMLYKFIENKIKPLYRIIGTPSKELNKNIAILEGDIRAWAERSRDQMEALKNLESYRKEFLGNVSHELKTPLFSLQGYVDMMLSGMEDRDMREKYLIRCDKNIERLINIVRDLEDISRLEDQNLILYKVSFDIGSLFREVVDRISNLADDRNVKISIVSRGAVIVNADRDRMEQVVVNLLSNAVKYNLDGGKVVVTFEDMFDKVMVQVSDTGIGIPKECQSRVFERFYRMDKARSRDTGGTGLGLSIVKHIIEAHGEKINVTSEQGKGTTFFFAINKAF